MGSLWRGWKSSVCANQIITMSDNQGFITADSINAELIVYECQQNGWLIYTLPSNICSKDQFFKAVRDNLPLEPPLQNKKSWDALADSLWSGLDSLPDSNILIIWPDTTTIKTKAPEDFDIAMEILVDLPHSLANAKLTLGKTKNLLILCVL